MPIISTKAYGFLADMQTVSDEVYVFYIGKSDKSSVFSDGWDAAAENYDPTDRDWYTKAVEAKKTVFSDPYIDVKTKELVITVSKPIFHDNGDISVVAADIFVTSVIDIAKSNVNGGYYPILIDSAGDIVVHRNDAYLPYVDNDGSEHYTVLRRLSEMRTEGYIQAQMKTVSFQSMQRKTSATMDGQ